jgi:S1-C subfamily serine protease
MNIKGIINWVRSKAKWSVLGLVAAGVVVAEVETGVGTQFLKDVKEAYDMPELTVSATAVRDVLESSVSLRCSHSDPGEGNGSGTIIHRFGHTYVLTAWHVLRCTINQRTNMDEKVYVDVYQGTNVWRGRAVNWNEKHDLALLRLEDVDLVGRSAVFFNPRYLPPIGARVLHAGNLFGSHPNSFSDGVLANLYVRSSLTPHTYFDQTTLTVYGGSSGGGAFTSDGRYLGMVVQMAAPSLNLIVPVRRMWDWADEDDLLWLFLNE